MLPASFEKHMKKTCRKCFTLFDRYRDYCCYKGEDECFADIGLVEKGIVQDAALRKKLYNHGKIDMQSKIKNRKFFHGRLKNECLVYEYRPPGCKSHFCGKWNSYIKKYPKDFLMSNVEDITKDELEDIMRAEFEFGIKLAYPGGFIVFSWYPEKVAKAIEKVLDGLNIHHFRTDAELMDPSDNEKEGVELIMDKDEILAKPRLFGTLINNNIFMLARMKMNMGSTGHNHSNIFLTTIEPEKLAGETEASLKSFHTMKAYQI